ncbi:MAG: sulfur globule protein CV3 [Thiogranum sp.]|nr:sulfur globule protein CV3 [Thiogranum sp.]
MDILSFKKFFIAALLTGATALPMSSANAFFGSWWPWNWDDDYYGYPGYYGYPNYYGGYPGYYGGYPSYYGGYPGYYGGYPGYYGGYPNYYGGGWGPWY